jgi:mannose/fructose/N-acetylgalactosamine-specific phosphotransferase system component IIC
MQLSVGKMLLLAFVCAFCKMESGWFGECKLRQPIVTGFLVGLVLGDVTNGLKIGAAFELIWMGTAGIGPVAHLDIVTGGVLGTTMALITGQGVEAGMLFAVPASMLMQFVSNITMTVYSAFNVMIDRNVAEGKFNTILPIHLLVGTVDVCVNFIITFAALAASNAIAGVIANGFPAWLENGLAGVAQLLPAFGFAMLLSIMMDTELIPFFILGFILAAYADVPYTMIGIGAIGLSLAWIWYLIASKFGGVKAAAADDEWED